jgi:uncharacterized protein (DUF58 family)
MRRALSALTFRGKALIAVGLGLGVGAALSGQRDVLRIAVLLLALPLVSVWLASRTHFRLGADRTVAPRHIPVGTTAQATLTVTNLARRRTPTLLLREHVDPHLGPPVDRVLEHVEGGGSRSTTFAVEGSSRGRFDVGPLSVTAVDPFGLVRLTRTFRSTQSVLVVPRVHALEGAVDADRRGRGDRASSALSAGGDDDVIPREYRPGDDLRRIHWRASAHGDELLVRREEQPWTRHATITVDLSEDGVGGPDSPLEVGLSMAASVSAHLMSRGWSIRLDALDGRCLVAQAEGSAGQARVLEALATVRPAPQVASETIRTGSDLSVVVLSSTPAALQRIPVVHHRSLAFVIDVTAWGLDGLTAPESLDRMRAHGWHASAVTGAAGSIPAAWQSAIDDASLTAAR